MMEEVLGIWYLEDVGRGWESRGSRSTVHGDQSETQNQRRYVGVMRRAEGHRSRSLILLERPQCKILLRPGTKYEIPSTALQSVRGGYGGEDGMRLVDAFVVFRCRVGVDDDPSTCLYPSLLALHHRCSQSDRGIEVP